MIFHYSGRSRRFRQRSEEKTETSPTMRVPGVRGQGERRRDPAQMSRVQGRVVLRQEPRHTAHGRARELLRRADSALRLPRVQATRVDQVWAVQGGDVLRRAAPVEALVGARGPVRGAARVGVPRPMSRSAPLRRRRDGRLRAPLGRQRSESRPRTGADAARGSGAIGRSRSPSRSALPRSRAGEAEAAEARRRSSRQRIETRDSADGEALCASSGKKRGRKRERGKEYIREGVK